MQSAFVDIGLERDAFLYVSDFMELENQDDDLEDIPTPRTAEFKEAVQVPAAEAALAAPSSETQNEPASESRQESRESSGSRDQRDRDSWRGRRRRRGSRDRGPEPSRISRSSAAEPRHDREEYGPPAGYQPILLPGESISKYRQTTAAPVEKAAASPGSRGMAIADTFPQDEPLFADSAATREHPVEHEYVGEERSVETESSPHEATVGSLEWDREQKRLHELNVAAAFGGGETEVAATEQEESAEHSTFSESERSAQSSVSSGTIEEEEIDEEEAGLASYVEQLDEDAAFDEFATGHSGCGRSGPLLSRAGFCTDS
jgi:ribonuclease G